MLPRKNVIVFQKQCLLPQEGLYLTQDDNIRGNRFGFKRWNHTYNIYNLHEWLLCKRSILFIIVDCTLTSSCSKTPTSNKTCNRILQQVHPGICFNYLSGGLVPDQGFRPTPRTLLTEYARGNVQ